MEEAQNEKLFELKTQSSDSDDEAPVFPNYYVASQDLNAGTSFFVEASVFQFPASAPGTSCTTCGGEIPSNSPGPINCSLCGWPVCSSACETLAVHASNECRIFQANKMTYSSIMEQDLSSLDLAEIIKILRSISIQEQDPERWKTITSIEPPSLCLKENITKEGGAVPFLTKIFEEAKLDSYLDFLNEYLRNTDVFSSQGYVDQSHEPEKRFTDKYTTHIFLEASNFSHSCSPNCTWSLGGVPDFKIQVRTAVPIKKGEPLTVLRIQSGTMSLCGTLVRQQYLREVLGFQCKCKLCLDPTEFGTYMSAMVCTACRAKGGNGYVLPVDPLNLNENDQTWKCDSCDALSSVSKKLSKIKGLAQRFDRQLDDRTDAGTPKIKKMCKAMLDKYNDKSLHPNHWILQYATNALINCLSTITCTHRHSPLHSVGVVHTVVQLLINLTSHLNPILDKVVPGISSQQTLIKMQAYSALLSLLVHDFISYETATEERINEMIAMHGRLTRMREDIYQYFKGWSLPLDQWKEKYLEKMEAGVSSTNVVNNILQDKLNSLQIKEESVTADVDKTDLRTI